MRYFLEISYKGTAYAGWQLQPNAITVQEILEKELSKLLSTKTAVMASGRTDTGVHAASNWIHFDTAKSIVDESNFLYRLNLMLPSDIAVKTLRKVWRNANTRFDAEWRVYTYRIDKIKKAFNQENSYLYFKPLDIQKMNEACLFLIGRQDFEAFSKVKTEVNNFYCDIKEAFWQEFEEGFIFTIKANRFLRGMVRAIVGTLLEVGRGNQRPDHVQTVISSKNRSKAGNAAPALGLTLEQVFYPENVFNLNFEIVEAELNEMPEIKNLMVAYQKFLGVDLCFQGFEKELESLPDPYFSILLAKMNHEILGIVALKKRSESEVEFKRLFVPEINKGYGLGKMLLSRALIISKEKGFRVVKLDTLARLETANHLYFELGFELCQAYNLNPEVDVKYFEKKI
jgi:tRNA pseudouridine38-40 synthase